MEELMSRNVHMNVAVTNAMTVVPPGPVLLPWVRVAPHSVLGTSRTRKRKTRPADAGPPDASTVFLDPAGLSFI